MPNTYQIGRTGRVFAAKQSAYGTAPTFAATARIDADAKVQMAQISAQASTVCQRRRSSRKLDSWSRSAMLPPKPVRRVTWASPALFCSGYRYQKMLLRKNCNS